uniref:Uncharacterized protein n=1 Tax=Equus asinus TaxID=9793 RepID=A0A8C4L5G8_EQUAS
LKRTTRNKHICIKEKAKVPLQLAPTPVHCPEVNSATVGALLSWGASPLASLQAFNPERSLNAGLHAVEAGGLTHGVALPN